MGQALSRAEGAQQAAAASLFAGWQEKLIASALEGAMGGVWMLEDTPGGALAECGDFLFLEARDSQTARNPADGVEARARGALRHSCGARLRIVSAGA